MNIIEFAKRSLGKAIDNRIQTAAIASAPRIDSGLPLGLRLGGLLDMPRSLFAVLEGSLVAIPTASQLPIVAISTLKMASAPDLRVYRAYTTVGADGVGEAFLQLLVLSGQVQEATYFQFFCRDIPQTAEDQEPFMGKGFGLGELDYWLGDDKLDQAGVTTEIAGTLLREDDAVHFVRDTPGSEAYVAPFVFSETRVDDAYGEHGLKQDVRLMPYARTLVDGSIERLLISMEFQKTKDGLEKPALHVDYMVGVAIPLPKVKVI